MSAPERKLRVLCDLRPALDGHSGIPQASRLLFRHLAGMPSLEVEGLLQHGTHLLARGLAEEPSGTGTQLSAHKRLDRLGRVVISIEQQRFKAHIQATAYMLGMALAQLFGKRHQLTSFDGSPFSDYLWTRLFAKTLRPEDQKLVTNRTFKILRAPWHGHHIAGLCTRWLGSAKYPRLNTRGTDVLIAETPFPAIVSPGTQLVIRYHDTFPLTMPHTIKTRQYHQAAHYHALKANVENNAHFICVSETTRQALLAIFPQAAARAFTIHNTISDQYFNEDSPPRLATDIIRMRHNASARKHYKKRHDLGYISVNNADCIEYLLCVATIEPRKNHLTLLNAWERLRSDGFAYLKLVLVGEPGWHHESTMRRLKPWTASGDVIHLQNVPANELRVLYKHASATICPSSGEGFGYTGIECMTAGGAVVASDIPIHREIYGSAAAYAGLHNADDMASSIQRVVGKGSTTYRAQLVYEGERQSQLYASTKIAANYAEFFKRLSMHI
jgi:glycosyltransferase involved in cell wall biosynthesis